MRDINKLAAAGMEKITTRQDLKTDEFRVLYDMITAAARPTEGIYNAITTAFYLGFEIGKRAK